MPSKKLMDSQPPAAQSELLLLRLVANSLYVIIAQPQPRGKLLLAQYMKTQLEKKDISEQLSPHTASHVGADK